MKKPNNLSNIQAWMHNIIVNRGAVRHKLQVAAQEQQLSIFDVIAFKKNIPLLSRLQVYTSGFEIRLIECLRADYPLLRTFMTDAVFDQFVRAYLHFRQPSSYTLFDLGADFPAFLNASKPKHLQEEAQDQFNFPYALACYERAFLESTRAKGTENETLNDELEAGVESVSFFEMPMVQTVPCLRCLALEFPVEDFIYTLKKEEAIPPIPARAKTYLAITRQAYRMKIVELEAWQYHFLEVAQAPIAASKAARNAAEKVGEESGKLIADAMFFLPQAFQDNLLQKLA